MKKQTKLNFEQLRDSFAAICKAFNPCGSEYSRLLKSTNEAEMLKVISDNLSWCISNKVISHEFFKQFDKETYINSGIANTREENTGFMNSGYSNSGNRNSGDWNSGDWNSGDSNSGNWNSGDSNSGYRNSGNWNSGYRNSGDSNSGYRNSGAFCTDTNPKLILFDQLTNITVKEWEQMEVCQLMYSIEPTIWVPMSIMTDEEKGSHPKYETTEGYLKTISMHEAWANFWHNLNEDKKKLFTSLPNFDAVKFKEITGITI